MLQLLLLYSYYRVIYIINHYYYSIYPAVIQLKQRSSISKTSCAILLRGPFALLFQLEYEHSVHIPSFEGQFDAPFKYRYALGQGSRLGWYVSCNNFTNHKATGVCGLTRRLTCGTKGSLLWIHQFLRAGTQGYLRKRLVTPSRAVEQ